MDVYQVRFGNYPIGNSNQGNNKNEYVPEDKELPAENAQEGMSASGAQEFFDAMEIVAGQNMAHVNFAPKKELVVEDYVDAESQANIEAMMADFEAGVNDAAAAIADEFPGVFSDAQRYALAAEVFARQG